MKRRSEREVGRERRRIERSSKDIVILMMRAGGTAG